MKTKYRIVSDGYQQYLEYLVTTEILFWKHEKWCRVWKPHYDEIFGRDYVSLDWYLYVEGSDDELKEFTNKWSNIEEYFKWAECEQTKLEEEVKIKREERKRRSEKVKYL